MVHYTLHKTIGGGMNDIADQAPAAINSITGMQAAENYQITVLRSGEPIFKNISWGTLGGNAIFGTNDAQHHSIRLMPPASNLSTSAQNVGATANAMQNVEGTIYYQDGTRELFSIIPEDNTYTALEDKLNTLLDNEPVSLNELNDNDNSIEPGDSYRIEISADAQNSQGKKVALVLINAQGAFDHTNMNAPEGGLRLFPGAVPNVQPDIYQPGDKIQVEINTSILDPAGNNLEASKSEVSANAS